MIFATVGTQLPFDRLLISLNEWAKRHSGYPIFAQTGPSTLVFDHLEAARNLGQADFQERVTSARLIVAHAGIGTILSAAELAKPIIVMPRRKVLGEHRSNHQIDTAEKLKHLGNVTIAQDEAALWRAINHAIAQDFCCEPAEGVSAFSRRNALIQTVRDFTLGASTTVPTPLTLEPQVAK